MVVVQADVAGRMVRTGARLLACWTAGVAAAQRVVAVVVFLVLLAVKKAPVSSGGGDHGPRRWDGESADASETHGGRLWNRP